jgi:signal transduction histidine kinase
MNVSEQERFYLERVLGNANHMLGVVDDMLDLSVIESGKYKINISETDLNQFIGETLGDLGGLEKAGKVGIHVVIPSGTRSIETDRQKLRQILINLLSNAVKFTHQGSITVQVHDDEFLRPVRIDVADTGDGIPEDKQEKIFEAFERGDNGPRPEIKGTGLGLTISRSLCAAMGYRLSLRSVLGKGSTFTIELAPATVAPAI